MLHYSNRKIGPIALAALCISLIGCSTNTPDSPSVPELPFAVAFNSKTNQIYTGDLSGHITFISGTTGEVTATINGGGSPYGLGVNPNTGNLYVKDAVTDQLCTINVSTVSTSGCQSLGSGFTSTDTIVINTAGNVVYVLGTNNTIAVINGSTGKVSGSFTVNNSFPATSLFYDSVNNRLLVADGKELTVLDATSGQTLSSVIYNSNTSSITSQTVTALAFNQTTGVAYVNNGYGTSTIYVISPSSSSVTGTFTSSELAGPMLSDDTLGELFAVSGDTNHGFAVEALSESTGGFLYAGGGSLYEINSIAFDSFSKEILAASDGAGLNALAVH